MSDIEVCRPHVSALLWDSILGTPFKPNLESDVMKKTRGRPRKNMNKNTHKMSDAEPEIRNLLPSTIRKIIADYKEYVQEGVTPKQALENVCNLYRVSYAQTFNICVDEY